jgi:pimeloyl-ACP methyl ester carboxylesterase
MRRLLRWTLALLAASALVWFAAAPLSFKGGWRRPLVGSPADYGVGFETVEFRPRDQPLTLRAWWMPVAEPKAAVLLVHGGSGNRTYPFTDWLRLARDLVDRRYPVLGLDLRNHGESDDSPAGNTFGVEEREDVIAAMDYLERRQPGMRFAGLGYSMGGQTLLYAAARDERLEAVIEDATYAEAGSITANFAHAASGWPKQLFSAPFLWSAEYMHGIPLSRARAVEVIGSLAPRPVMLIHDEADPIVPVDHARRLQAAYPAAEVWITSTPAEQLPADARSRFGTHAKSYALHRDEYVRRVTAFLDRVFDAPPSQL